MKKLMLSLDKKILDKDSAVAKRMVEYGKDDELYILIPGREKKKFDLSPNVHVESTGGGKLKQYLALKKKGRRLIEENSIKFITVQDPSFSGNVGSWLKKKTKATLEIQLHGDFYGADFYRKKIKDRLGYFFFGKRNLSTADRVRVVSERVRQSVLKLGFPPEKIIVKSVPILSGGAYKTFERIDVKSSFPGYQKYFLFVGRLEKVKNLEWLIEIFDEIVNERGLNYLLLVLGEGSMKNDLRREVESKKMNKNIIFKGWTSEPCQYYESVDCVLYPSLSEGYGLVPMEAFAAGTKLIMNDVGVANFELKQNDKVKIISIEDRQAWIEAIKST